MFLIKSTFWLGLAFVIIQPPSLDFNDKKEAISSAAVNAGQIALTKSQNSLASKIKTIECKTIQCSGTKAFLLVSNSSKLASNDNRTPTNALPMQEAHSQLNAPIPQARIKRAG